VRTGHTYHGKCCYEELVHRGLSLKAGPSLMQPGARLDVLIHTLPPPLLPQVIRERAAQRDESQRAMYWQAVFEEPLGTARPKPVISFRSHRGIARQAITTAINSNFAAARLTSST